jgi:polyhydroxyalkanoate synthesis regulator phasin
MADALQSYVKLVSGLTKTTRDRAVATAQALLAQAGLTEVAHDAGERVNKLAEEIINAGRANRELLENLIAAEVHKAATRFGFARADEIQALRDEIAELRAALSEAPAAAAEATPSARPRTRRTTTSATKKTAAAPAKKTAAAPAKKTAAAAKRPADGA